MRLPSIFIFLFVFAGILLAPAQSQAQAPHMEMHREVSLRMIGHQVLLDAGDSTSRVLPIEKEEEQDKYRIQFDSEFQFIPEELVATVRRVMGETALSESYIIAVEECATGKVVYSYQIGFLAYADIIPCKSRPLPKACYTLLFTLLDVDQPTIASNPVAVVVEEGGSSEMNKMAYPLIAILSVLMIGGLVVLRKKRRQPKIDPNMIALGDYQLDKLNTELIFDKQRITLTSKEADLLMLLYEAVNTTIEREVMLQRVWGDEGDYVGRTLDVFISKLRKKLQADPKVKIVNIRGVGYKLVVGA